MDFNNWIETTMGMCAEASGARLRKNALALGTITVSLSSEDDIGKLDDLHDLSVKFFKRWLAIYEIVPNYSIIHLDEANPHFHIWATPAPAQYEKKRWKLSDAFNLAGQDLQLLQGLFNHEVGKPLGLSRKGIEPQGRRFSRRTLRTMQMNPLYLRYAPQYEAGFINAIDRLFRTGEFPQAFLEKVILSELDEESVNLFRERCELPEIDPYVHYKLRETEIEPAKFNSRFGMNDLLNPWNASNNFDESASW